MAEDSVAGQIVDGRYRLSRLLGEGGMGAVYVAEHVHITKKVALKLLHPDVGSDEEAVRRFRQEAQSASRIGHSNIVTIDDFGQMPDGRVYLCMELLEGQSLADAIAADVMEPLRSAEIICQVCDGLGAAHAKGIIHRDMKPENVFLAQCADGSERVKILDFGIAKATGSENHNLTKTGMVFGTPNYMSPEQALGQKIDHRADIYAVGVILFEIFTGAVPFKSESLMGVLSQHITKPVPNPAAVNPSRPVHPAMVQIIYDAMAKDPGERVQDMGSLKDRILSFRSLVAAEGKEAAATRLGAASPSQPSFLCSSGDEASSTRSAYRQVGPTGTPVGTRLTASNYETRSHQGESLSDRSDTLAQTVPPTQRVPVAFENTLPNTLVPTDQTPADGGNTAGGANVLATLTPDSEQVERLYRRRVLAIGLGIAGAVLVAGALALGFFSESIMGGPETTSPAAKEFTEGDGSISQVVLAGRAPLQADASVMEVDDPSSVGPSKRRSSKPKKEKSAAQRRRVISRVGDTGITAMVSVRIVSTPENALVFSWNGSWKRLGRTPQRLELARGSRTKLKLAHGGRADTIAYVVADREKIQRVVLEAKAFDY